ncbi:hypothetical protein [Amycolatopsis benzoatilytica]|uniref:hypothetical protein n=1 Tax=Amycolatopsis benzoatilytica TaxID=346045 RepID=UPI000364A04D|nr:hypothetical protein [Amycolatopsis benzoatilytica]
MGFLFLLAVLVLLAVLPWRRGAKPWALGTILVFSASLFLYGRWFADGAGQWPLLAWPIMLGPGCLIAIVRLWRAEPKRRP